MNKAQIDYRDMIEEIFALNKSIRYAGIFYNGFTITKMREGLQNLLTPEETKYSLGDTLTRWKTRQSLSGKLGKPLYAMAEYEKIKRITIPLNEDGVLLISTESAFYHEIMIKEIIDIRDRYLN